MAGVTRFFFPTFRSANVPMRLLHPEWVTGRSYSHKCFRCNTYGSPRKCCKQKTYGIAKLFRCNTYKKQGGTSFKQAVPYPVTSSLHYLARRSWRGRMEYGGPAGEEGGAVDEGRTPVVRLLRRSRQRGSSPEARRGWLDPSWRACPACAWQARASRHR